MVKCDDYWCEHNGKATGNCDRCTKKEVNTGKSDFRIIIQNRTVEQKELSHEKSTSAANNIIRQER